MASAAKAVAFKTKARAGRTARASKNVIYSATGDSTTSLRLQRLRLLGIIGQRANLLADLAWETVNANR